MKRLFTLLLVIAAACGSIFADTIKLKDGSIFKGRIVGFAQGKFTVQIGEGSRSRQMTFAANEVDAVIFEPMQPAAEQNVNYVPAVRQPNAPAPHPVVSVETTVTEPDEEKPAATAPTVPEQPVVTSNAGKATPILWQIDVASDNTSNGWTNTGWVVKKGQKIRISAEGDISLGNGKTADPSGSSDITDPDKLLKSVPTGALIAVIGDDNNEFLYIGRERTLTATRDGILFLGVNEAVLDDNKGSFRATVEIIP